VADLSKNHGNGPIFQSSPAFWVVCVPKLPTLGTLVRRNASKWGDADVETIHDPTKRLPIMRLHK